jgi:hypothetical protein
MLVEELNDEPGDCIAMRIDAVLAAIRTAGLDPVYEEARKLISSLDAAPPVPQVLCSEPISDALGALRRLLESMEEPDADPTT